MKWECHGITSSRQNKSMQKWFWQCAGYDKFAFRLLSSATVTIINSARPITGITFEPRDLPFCDRARFVCVLDFICMKHASATVKHSREPCWLLLTFPRNYKNYVSTWRCAHVRAKWQDLCNYFSDIKCCDATRRVCVHAEKTTRRIPIRSINGIARGIADENYLRLRRLSVKKRVQDTRYKIQAAEWFPKRRLSSLKLASKSKIQSALQPCRY
jgi:hypothetical protein